MIDSAFWMYRALQLASLGLGKVQPNPLVGAVVVHNERIIGEGFHRQYGTQHAEVHAIASVKDKKLLKDATLYVNLEPCAHYGKTPPCTSLIIEQQIPKVVIGMRDPNEKVNGKGIQLLRNAGIEVIENVLKGECMKLNKRYTTYITKKRPYIFLKWAQTKNGLMDVVRNENSSHSYWITNDALRVWAHKLRQEEQAILIGYNTLINDNPQLTNRLYGTNQPLRFVWCEANKPALTNPSFDFLYGTIKEVLDPLYNLKIQSVIVEGGKKTLQKFLATDLWDEIFVLTGNVGWNCGVEAPNLPHYFHHKLFIEKDTVTHFLKE